MFNICEFVSTAENYGKEISEMSSIELATMCDVIFKNNPKVAEWIARDLEVRAMDKAIVEAELKGELYD